MMLEADNVSINNMHVLVCARDKCTVHLCDVLAADCKSENTDKVGEWAMLVKGLIHAGHMLILFDLHSSHKRELRDRGARP